MKRFFYISGNASSEIPSNLLFVDTESKITRRDKDHSELRLRIWTAQTVRIEKETIRTNHYYDGTTADEFWRLAYEQLQMKKPLWIFAHNAKFDMRQLCLWNQFDDYQLRYIPKTQSKKSGIMAIDGNPWFIKCHHKTGAVVWIVDTRNYFHCSVDELGKSVNLPKLEIDFESCSNEELLTYCVRDCEIIKLAMTNLLCEWHKQDNGCFRTSSAGLSLQNFRHFVCDSREKKLNGITRYSIGAATDCEEEEFERAGYLGGRIEAFRIGSYSGKFYHLDVKSMYPSVMIDNYYPITRLEVLSEPETKIVHKLMPAFGVTAEVLVNSKQRTYPIKKGMRQLHCTGKFWTVLCGKELMRALDNDDVELVSKAITYRTAPIFTEWCLYWLERRRQAEMACNAAEIGFCKMVINCLHGKFAQKGIKWEDTKDAPPRLSETKWMRWGVFHKSSDGSDVIERFRVIDGKVQREVEGKSPIHAFPAISAMIAADVRERLLDLINICPKKSVLYVATDSLIVTEKGYRALLKAGEVCKGEVGKLQVLGTHKECEIVSQGCYRLDDKWTVCGIFGKSDRDELGKWKACEFRFDDLIDIDKDGVVYVNTVYSQKPKSRPKGVESDDGWLIPIEINKPKSFYDLPIAEQRKILYMEQN